MLVIVPSHDNDQLRTASKSKPLLSDSDQVMMNDTVLNADDNITNDSQPN